MRLEVNTSGSWKIVCRDIPADQLDAVRDACEVLCNVSMPKMLAWRLTNCVGDGKTWYRADSLDKWPGKPATWESRK